MSSDLHVIVLPEGKDTAVAPNSIPAISDKDICVIFTPATDGTSTGDFAIFDHVPGAGSKAISTKRKVGTIMNGCQELVTDRYNDVAKFDGEIRFTFVDNECDKHWTCNAILNLLKDIKKDEDDWSKFAPIETIVRSRGTIIASLPLATGGMSAFVDFPLDVRDVSMEEIEPGRIVDLIKLLDKNIAYEGFNPSITRNEFYKKFSAQGKDIFTRELSVILLSYCHIGNNSSKLSKKRVDLSWAKKVLDRIDTLNIVKKGETKTSLTLPRIAISFMPELLAIRAHLAVNLQKQTTSGIDLMYQDLSFSGCTLINKISGYEAFNKEMSAMIFDMKKETDVTDVAFLKNYKRWNKISEKGYQNDAVMNTRMSEVFTSSGWTPKDAYDFISRAFDDKSYVEKV